MIIKRVGILSVAKYFGCLYAVLGLIGGAVISVLALAGASLARGGQHDATALLFGVGAVVVLPVVYGVMGFFVGLVMAVIYNIISSVTGGIELEVEQSRDDDRDHRWRD